jgi:hypothetical protein
MAIRYLISDWRKRRKAIRAYLRSRQPDTQLESGKRRRRSRKTAKPGKALPKLPTRDARIRRVAVWRKMRPILRWHRRKPVALVLAVYLGVPAVVCLAACLWLLQSGSQPPPSPATTPPGGPVAIQLGAPAKPALREENLAPDKVSALQLQAEEAFRKGDFATAEALYQKLFPQAKHKAFTGFHLFLCLIQQGKFQEAQLLANQATPRTVPKNPVTFYMAAALAMKSGQPAQAAESISRAHELFPNMSVFYDKALREAGLEPSSTTTTDPGHSGSGG